LGSETIILWRPLGLMTQTQCFLKDKVVEVRATTPGCSFSRLCRDFSGTHAEMGHELTFRGMGETQLSVLRIEHRLGKYFYH
jgi:hypothetical protein